MNIREILTAFSLSLLVTQTANAQPQDQGSRFAHAKRTIVPSSRFNRRFDNESVSETEEQSATGSAAGSGLVAPPPPNTVGPNELSAGKPLKGNWSSPAVKTTLKDTSTLVKAKARVQPLLAAGKYDTALTLMKTYVRSYPDDKSLKSELARVAILDSEHQLQLSLPLAAASAAREALTAEPGSQPARNALSQALSKLGIDPGKATERLKIADGLLAQGRDEEAAVEYSESIRFKPTAEAHIGLGDARLREGHDELAKNEYQKALEINPNSATALRQLGLVRLHEGDVVGANEALSKALILHPGDKAASSKLIELWHAQVSRSPGSANGHMGLARAYQLSGDLSSAQSEYRQVVRLEPSHPKLDQARKSFKVALAHQQAQHLFDNAHALEAQGMLKDAYQKSAEAVTLNPTNVTMRLYHGEVSQKLGYNAEAKTAYLAVLKQEPGNDEAARALNSLPAVIAEETPLAPPIPVQAAAGLPPVAPRVVPMPYVPPTAAAGAVGSPIMAAQPGSVIIPGNTAGDPQALPGKPYSTTQHVGTMSNFLGQLRGLAQAAQPADTTSGADSALGGIGALAGGALSTASIGDTAHTLATAPPIDTGGAADALAQAAAALKSAGASPTLSTTASSTAVSSTAGSTAAASATASAAGSAAPAVAPATAKAPSFTAFAQQAFPGIAKKIDSNKVSLMAKQYGPMFAAATATMTPAQMDAMYATYKPMLEQTLGRKLPDKLPPGTTATAVQMSKQGAPPDVVAQTVITAALGDPTLAANSTSSATQQAFTSMTPALVQISASPNLNDWNPAGVPLSVFDAEPPMVTPEPITPVATAAKSDAVAPTTDVQATGLNAWSKVSVPNSSAVVTAVGGTSALISQLAPKKGAAPVHAAVAATSFTTPTASATPSSSTAGAPIPSPAATQTGSDPELRGPLGSTTSNVIAAAATPLPGAEPLRDFLPPPPTGSTSVVAPLKLELLGVQPTSSDIRLQVRLRNTQSVAFKVPSGLKAIVSMNGKKQTAHVEFPSNTVPANGELKGVIKLTGHDLNPSADLWIPNLMPGTGDSRNLHLSVSVPVAPL